MDQLSGLQRQVLGDTAERQVLEDAAQRQVLGDAAQRQVLGDAAQKQVLGDAAWPSEIDDGYHVLRRLRRGPLILSLLVTMRVGGTSVDEGYLPTASWAPEHGNQAFLGGCDQLQGQTWSPRLGYDTLSNLPVVPRLGP